MAWKLEEFGGVGIALELFGVRVAFEPIDCVGDVSRRGDFSARAEGKSVSAGRLTGLKLSIASIGGSNGIVEVSIAVVAVVSAG